MLLKSRISCFLLTALALVTLTMPLAAADRATSRYDRLLRQYDSLPQSEQATWLSWLFTSRLEPACRLTMTRDAYDQVEEQQLAVLNRVRGGEALSHDGLRKTLELVDRQETAAIALLTKTYALVTHEAVGTNLWLYQQRMNLFKKIRELEQLSPYPFENQSKLIGWLDAAILQQRLTDRSPLPKTPDFSRVEERPWLLASAATTQVKTALQEKDPQPTAAELSAQITRYNDELNKVVAGLYTEKRYNVAELNTVVDDLARLGLTRIRLSTNSLRVGSNQRPQLPQIETLDDAIALARVKVSATRREMLKLADRSTDRAPWDALKGLNGVSRRLDTLYTGPDR